MPKYYNPGRLTLYNKYQIEAWARSKQASDDILFLKLYGMVGMRDCDPDKFRDVTIYNFSM
jgi:hypothetical protein